MNLLESGDYPGWINNLQIANTTSIDLSEHAYLLDDHLTHAGQHETVEIITHLISNDWDCATGDEKACHES